MHLLDSRIIDEAGRPTTDLLKLLYHLGLENDGSLASIVEVTQQRLFQRKKDGQARERWELEEIIPDIQTAPIRQLAEEAAPVLRDRYMDFLGRLGMLEEIHPCCADYDYGLLLGALVIRVRSRLAHLVRLWSDGCPDRSIAQVRFETIVFLGSERPLLPDKESMAILLDANNGVMPFRKGWTFSGQEPKTELEMMQLVWDQSDIPDEMRIRPVTWVNAKMKLGPEGQKPERPNTGDTLRTWLEDYDPMPGCCLAVSNQPHVGYQDAVLRTHLPASFTVETVGTGASLEHQLAFYLRELAGWLRQLQILQSAASR